MARGGESQSLLVKMQAHEPTPSELNFKRNEKGADGYLGWTNIQHGLLSSSIALEMYLLYLYIHTCIHTIYHYIGEGFLIITILQCIIILIIN